MGCLFHVMSKNKWKGTNMDVSHNNITHTSINIVRTKCPYRDKVFGKDILDVEYLAYKEDNFRSFVESD